MKRMLLSLLVLWLVVTGYSQGLSADHLLNAISVPPNKTDNFIGQRGFLPAGTDYQQDTLVYIYRFRPKKNNKKDTILRTVRVMRAKQDQQLVYQTASFAEFQTFRKQLEKEGFVYSRPLDSTPCARQLFLKRNYIAETWLEADADSMYTVRVKKRELPDIRNILHGEDLLDFNSHEELLTVFGSRSVKKDLYYFSEHEFSRCSVLFPNTDKQAVFIWQDEANNYGLSYLVLGGQLMLQSTVDYHFPVAENSWMLKSKVHAGMNLRELRRLNGNDFTFYNVRTKFSGMVLPASTGNIDFKREGVILACINCSDIEKSDKSTLSADEALAEGRNIFVFTIMLYPPSLTLR